MEKIGAFLKKQREREKLSLEEIADRTKIHIYKLTAIENGDRDSLPAKVFCIGLIKSYARELKVDLNEVDKLCQQAFNEVVDDPEQSTSINSDVEVEANGENQTVGVLQFPKTLGIAASIIVSIILISGIVWVVQKINAYSKEEQLPAEVFSKPIDETNSNSMEINPEESVAGPKIEKVEPEETSINMLPESSDTKSTTTKAAAAKDFQEENNFSGEQTTKEPTVSEKVVASDNKIVITALEPIQAKIIWSDGFVQTMLLKSNESKTLVFSTPIKLRLNNGGAAQVSFNGAEKKIPGTFNQPIELTYP